MKISVHREKCAGAGNCVQVAPSYFGQDAKTGVVLLLREDVDPKDRADIEQAVVLCPVAAITFHSGS